MKEQDLVISQSLFNKVMDIVATAKTDKSFVEMNELFQEIQENVKPLEVDAVPEEEKATKFKVEK